MQHLFSSLERPLPDVLQDDLEELLTWDNNCYLTWNSVSTESDPDGSRWFTVKLNGVQGRFVLRLEFWIPEWMSRRGVEAVLPASLLVSEHRPGVSAAVDLPPRTWPELRASIPKVARTCARVLNDLWGPTEPDGVLLLTVEYQDELLEAPFKHAGSG